MLKSATMDLYLSVTQKSIINLVAFSDQLNDDEFKRHKMLIEVLLEQSKNFETLLRETMDLQKGFGNEKRTLDTKIGTLEVKVRDLEESVRAEQMKNSMLQQQIQKIEAQETSSADSLETERKKVLELTQTVASLKAEMKAHGRTHNTHVLTYEHLQQAAARLDKSLTQTQHDITFVIQQSGAKLEQAMANRDWTSNFPRQPTRSSMGNPNVSVSIIDYFVSI